MSEIPQYIDGEKVLCYHGPLLYEAKCLKSEIQDNTMKYFIHYSGWNKNWDEWVPEGRILKYTDVNLLKQKELQEEHKPTPKRTKRSSSSAKRVSEKVKEITPLVEKSIKQPKIEKRVAIGPVECPSKQPEPKRAKSLKTSRAKVSQPKKRRASEPKDTKVSAPKKRKVSKPKKVKMPEPIKIKIEPVSPEPELPEPELPEPELPEPESPGPESSEPVKVELTKEKILEDEPKPPVQIKLSIPEKLRDWLVDDEDLINHKRMLMRLPARITVDHIIANFIKDRVEGKELEENVEREIISVGNKIRDTFNVFLGKRCLYRFERLQYAELLADYPEKRMSEIYGAIHLLRMFTFLGDMLTPCVEKFGSMEDLVARLDDFIGYLETNSTFFSLDDFDNATPEYYRRALT